jgi:hypothetical protein
LSYSGYRDGRHRPHLRNQLHVHGRADDVLGVPNGNYGTPSTVRGFEQALDQTLLEMTPTRSRFYLQGGGVGLVIEFLSPVEIADQRRRSIPMSYVLMTARSIDGKAHDVQLYVDISGEWTSGTTPT